MGEGRPLGQEAVARMHGLRAAAFRGGDDLVDQEVAFGRGRRADQHRLVGHLHMDRVTMASE